MAETIDHSKELSDRVLATLKTRFYSEREKLYFQELGLLQQAISTPAAYLFERSRDLPAERLEFIILTVVRTIVEKAGPDQIHSFGRYFLKSMQSHMAHHGEEYLEAAKSHQSVIEHQLMGFKKASEKQVKIDKTCEALAAANKVLSVKAGRTKSVAKTQRQQLELL
jgi:hypothetical protein